MLSHNTPLKLLNEDKAFKGLTGIVPTLNSLTIKGNILTLNFTNQKPIILPLTSTMTWGQLIESLKEKGLTHESN